MRVGDKAHAVFVGFIASPHRKKEGEKR